MAEALYKDAADKVTRTLIALVDAARVPRDRDETSAPNSDVASVPTGQTAHAVVMVATADFFTSDVDVRTRQVIPNTFLRELLFGRATGRGRAASGGGESPTHSSGPADSATQGIFEQCLPVANRQLRNLRAEGAEVSCVACASNLAGVPVRATPPLPRTVADARRHLPPLSSDGQVVLLLVPAGHMSRENWFYNGICRKLRPLYVYASSPGTVPGRRTVKRLFSVLNRSRQVAACSGPLHGPAACPPAAGVSAGPRSPPFPIPHPFLQPRGPWARCSPCGGR